MTNRIVYVVVEGPSERDFIQAVVAPVLGAEGVYISPSVVGKPGHKGGNIKFERVLTDIKNYLNQQSDTIVSTMIDYFRLHPEWPGMQDIRQREQGGQQLTLQEKSGVLYQATSDAVCKCLGGIDRVRSRFVPYIQMHEYEALLFSAPGKLATHLNIAENRVMEIVEAYPTPEHINTDPEKAPATTIAKLSSKKYHKRRDGLVIAKAIGLDDIRNQCRLFDSWLEQLGEQ